MKIENKYKKSLEFLAEHLEESQENLKLNYELGNALYDLDELVNKNEPLKPKNTGYQRYICPVCNHSLFHDEELNRPNYCMACGQALDWSKNE